MAAKLSALWASVPDGLKLVARDALEAGIAALASLTLTVPLSVDDAKSEALIVSFAVGAAVIAVLRREALPWLLAKLVSQPPTPGADPPSAAVSAPPAAPVTDATPPDQG